MPDAGNGRLLSQRENMDTVKRPPPGDLSDSLKKFRFTVAALVLVILGGSYGYWLLELRPRGYELVEGLIQGFYFVIATISTTGYGDETPQTLTGRVYVALFIIIGIFALARAGGAALSYLLEGQFTEEVRRRKMRRKLESTQNHYILCGLGRVGVAVLEEFRAARRPFVAVDPRQDVLEAVLLPDELFVVGSATEDATLKEAGVERAAGLVTCMPSDADNVFAVLSAKDLNRDLFVISRAEVEESRSKLQHAGANRVVLPSDLSGKRIAAMALRPAVVDFLDRTVSLAGEERLLIEEIKLGPNSPLIGKSLRQANIKTETNVMILGVKSPEAPIRVNPAATLILNEGDTLVGIGRDEDFTSLCRLAKDPSQPDRDSLCPSITSQHKSD